MSDPADYACQSNQLSCKVLRDEIERLRAEVLTLRERVAFLESPEVCAAAHDDVSECGYCQRDRYYPGYIRYEYLRTLSVRAIANLWASSFMPSGLPLDETVDRARLASSMKESSRGD